VNRAWVLLALAFSLACERGELLGRVGGTVASGGTGGAGEGGSSPDPIGPLSDPDARDTDPTFTGDLTELYFMSTRTGSKNVMVSLRADASSEWGPPALVPELVSDGDEENPRVAADGLRLWFYTNRDRGAGTIWQATRARRGDEWTALVPVPGLSLGPETSNVSAGMNADATLAVLSAARDGSGYDLYWFERANDGEAFGAPEPLTELNSASDDFDPYLSPNGLAVAFASNRRGSFDIFLARRTSLDVPFEAPVSLEQNSVDYEESAPNLSPDLAYLMYSSERQGTLDIYEARLFP
jgi:Tol biopolymer transport system component